MQAIVKMLSRHGFLVFGSRQSALDEPRDQHDRRERNEEAELDATASVVGGWKIVGVGRCSCEGTRHIAIVPVNGIGAQRSIALFRSRANLPLAVGQHAKSGLRCRTHLRKIVWENERRST